MSCRSRLPKRGGSWLTAPLVAVALWCSAPCRAESSHERATALLRAGNELFGRGDHQGALERYRQANALYPSYRIELNIGAALFAMGRAVEAAEQLERVVRHASTVADQTTLEGARRRLDQLRKQLGRIAMRCRVPGATLEIDAYPVGREPFGRWIYLRPGKHRVSVTAPGHHGSAQAVDLAAGDHLRLMASLTPITVEQPRTRAPAREQTPPAAVPVYKKWWFWTIVGAAVVGATVGGVVAAKTGGSDRQPRGELTPDM